MTDNKNDKKNKNSFFYSDGEGGEDMVVNFTEIGNSIKRSVNSTLRRLTDMTETDDENLPQTRNRKVCAQVPPDLSRARTYQALTIFAAIAIAIFTMVCGIIFLEEGSFAWFLMTLLVLAVNVAAPVFLHLKSKDYFRLTNNYVRYLNELGNNTVISIRDLASSVAQSEEKTIEDLLYMMKNGYFLQARIVEDDSIFLLDIPTFKLYKEKKNELPNRTSMHVNNDAEMTAEEISTERAYEIITTSSNLLQNIDVNKEKITDQTFKANTETIIENTKAILQIIEKYPDKSYALNKFADYYLPTTAKLVETYWEFEAMRTDDPKIQKSMADINESVVTIGEAFEKIKVELLSDRAMDIKTEIDTINLLLNQEGYVNDDWGE